MRQYYVNIPRFFLVFCCLFILHIHANLTYFTLYDTWLYEVVHEIWDIIEYTFNDDWLFLVIRSIPRYIFRLSDITINACSVSPHSPWCIPRLLCAIPYIYWLYRYVSSTATCIRIMWDPINSVYPLLFPMCNTSTFALVRRYKVQPTYTYYPIIIVI